MAGMKELVMAGLDPAIHVFALCRRSKTWMPGSSPGMTVEKFMPRGHAMMD
jgi:hypothetical protein